MDFETIREITEDAHPASAGPRLRELRKARGLTQAEAAQRVGLSRSHLASLERGDEPMSFELVGKIADALEVSARDLGPDDSAENSLVVRRGSGGLTELDGVVWEELAEPHHALEPALLRIPPGAGSGPQLMHRPGDTFLHVLSGRLQVDVASVVDPIVAHRGDSVTLPAGASWRWFNPSSTTPARALYVEQARPA